LAVFPVQFKAHRDLPDHLYAGEPLEVLPAAHGLVEILLDHGQAEAQAEAEHGADQQRARDIARIRFFRDGGRIDDADAARAGGRLDLGLFVALDQIVEQVLMHRLGAAQSRQFHGLFEPLRALAAVLFEQIVVKSLPVAAGAEVDLLGDQAVGQHGAQLVGPAVFGRHRIGRVREDGAAQLALDRLDLAVQFRRIQAVSPGGNSQGIALVLKVREPLAQGGHLRKGFGGLQPGSLFARAFQLHIKGGEVAFGEAALGFGLFQDGLHLGDLAHHAAVFADENHLAGAAVLLQRPFRLLEAVLGLLALLVDKAHHILSALDIDLLIALTKDLGGDMGHFKGHNRRVGPRCNRHQPRIFVHRERDPAGRVIDLLRGHTRSVFQIIIGLKPDEHFIHIDLAAHDRLIILDRLALPHPVGVGIIALGTDAGIGGAFIDNKRGIGAVDRRAGQLIDRRSQEDQYERGNDNRFPPQSKVEIVAKLPLSG